MSIADAIRDHRLVTFTYDGLERVVQPATYGTTTTGKISLRGCLVDGQSRSNQIPCWELYTQSKILNLVVTTTPFSKFARAGYTRGDSGFTSIIAGF